MAIVMLVLAPLAADAQPLSKPARVGILYGASAVFSPETDPYDRGIVAGLRDHGYVVGQNVLIEFRSALGAVRPCPRDPVDRMTALGVHGRFDVIRVASLTNSGTFL